jgi:hypothetical protein
MFSRRDRFEPRLRRGSSPKCERRIDVELELDPGSRACVELHRVRLLD